MFRRVVLAVAGAVLTLLTAYSSAQAAGDFRIIKLVNGINRPDLPCPPCTPFYIFYTPVISGDHVAFLSRNGPPDGVWSGDINTRVLTKLVGLETPVPGGSGTFSEFFGNGEVPLTVGNGTVAFFGKDAAGVFGLFTVPIEGGSVRRIATLNRVSPDGSKFKDIRRASTNGSKVVFYGSTPNHFTGIYQTSINGSGLKTVIDDSTQLDARTPSGPAVGYFGIYTNPVIGKSIVDFYANGLFDPVSGPNAIFRGQYIDVADNLTKLEGGAPKHVRIFGLSADITSAAVAFRADLPETGFAGIFKVKNFDEAPAFVTTKNVSPGTGRKFSSFSGFGYDASGLAFVATYSTSTSSDQSIYFTAGLGQPIVRVASGKNYYFPTLGDRSVSDGKIVFMDGSNFADTVYVAVPHTP